ncbi:MAG: hypothetical protein MJ180_02870 [Candidatus Gastranaerophilales bacterium]|nr:hypothetical protein [Candidatus Gastranaerophilales bacterium]
MTKKIIIISGKQFSGKDTLAKFMLEVLPDFKRIGIGDAIKLEYGKRKNLTFEEIEKDKHLYRVDLIELGNWGRSQDADFWLKQLIERDENIIVPDIRVPHELELFKSHGAIAIRVEAPRDNRALRGTLAKENDPTETLLDNVENWDYIIQNDGTLEDLKQKAIILAEKLK